jgi:hypothetical protein
LYRSKIAGRGYFVLSKSYRRRSKNKKDVFFFKRRGQRTQISFQNQETPKVLGLNLHLVNLRSTRETQKQTRTTIWTETLVGHTQAKIYKLNFRETKSTRRTE